MNRLKYIDALRGFVMVVMALDHTRDLIHVAALTQDPLNLSTTTPLLFLTRWITHLCAPTFVFLSGLSAFLSIHNHQNHPNSHFFLLKRGIWLMVLEFTIVNFGIWFNPTFPILMSQVIAAIGFGLIVLSFLSKLSPRFVGLIGIVIVAGHQLVAGVSFPEGSVLAYVWGYLFKLSFWSITPNFTFFVNYPLIPWLGILLAGYGFGDILLNTRLPKPRLFLIAGLTLLFVFGVLRFFNLYGDPQPWSSVQKNTTFVFLSFFNVNKYPPSLLFVCVTLGVSFLILYVLSLQNNRFTTWMTVYGKVPLFYYIIHWYIIHTVMLFIMFGQGFKWAELNFAPFGFGRPAKGGGLDLWGVYTVWMGVVVSLYPLCAWYGKYKENNRQKWWLRYL